jgi:hypothetical protein
MVASKATTMAEAAMPDIAKKRSLCEASIGVRDARVGSRLRSGGGFDMEPKRSMRN